MAQAITIKYGKRVAKPRHFLTEFYGEGKEKRWVNRSAWPRQATKNAMDHLHEDKYCAWIAVVYDERDGRLYSITRRDVDGNIITMFRNDDFDQVFLSRLPEDWFPLNKGE